jgi:hypothetical protein
MDCPLCTQLTQTYQLAYDKYQAACKAAFSAVSSDLAASRLVDLERAKNDLAEHQDVCRRATQAAAAANPLAA